MHLFPAEVVVLEPIVVPLAMLCGLVIAFGLAYFADKIVRALFGGVSSAIGWIPWLGSKVTGPIHSIEARLTGALGDAIAGIDTRMGRSLHELAAVFEWIGSEIERNASTLLTVVQALTGTVTYGELRAALADIRRVTSALRHRADHALADIARLERAVEHAAAGKIGAAIHDATRPIAGELQAVERATLPRIRAVENELAGVVEPDIAALRERARTLEQEAIRAFEWARGQWKVLSVGAVAAAVAVALERLGLGWVKCRNVGRVGRAICGLPTRLLEDLLAGVFDVLLIADLCQLTKLLVITAESAPVQEALGGLIAGIDALLLCQKVGTPPPLTGYSAALPPLQAFSGLPA